MKHSKRLTAGGTWLVAAIACGGTKTTPPVDTRGADGASGSPAGADASRLGTSMVRLVNALPDQPTVDLTLDERQTFAAVVYRAGTPYQGVGNNVIQLRLTPAGLPNPLAETTETLTDGNSYTIIAFPQKEPGAGLRLLHDEVVPGSGKSQVRVVHAVPAMGQVDVAVQGRATALFAGVRYGAEAGYQELDPMTGVIEIRTDEAQSQTLSKSRRFEAGRAYTIVVMGRGAGQLECIVFEDTVLDFGETGQRRGSPRPAAQPGLAGNGPTK